MTTTATVIGNLTSDPEMKFTQSGKGITEFSVAVNRRTKRDGEWVDAPPEFYNCKFWSDEDNLADSLHKGDRVIVVGRLAQRSWTTDEGSKRSITEVIADEVGPSLRWAKATVTKANQ